MKYLRVKSLRDSTNILLTNCLLSLPFFQSVDSNRSGVTHQTKPSTLNAKKYMQNSAGIMLNIISTITWAVCLWKVFSSKFSPFVLCPDPLILQNTERKAKSKMDEYNSHCVWVCFCPQLIASSPFSSSTFLSTKKICWSFPSAVVMSRLSSKTLTCSRSAADGRRRQGHISHKWIWLQGFPSPAWTAAAGWHI